MQQILFALLTVFTATIFAQGNDQWETVFENSGYKATSGYVETINYFKRLDTASSYAKLIKFGNSSQGRDLNCLIVSEDKAFLPFYAKKTKKPVILVQSGIHAGEIEGKDASMLLLREILITKEREDLIENAVLMFIPILNVDGHERKSPYNRINQNGPAEMGWRTTARNLNLNRDFVKAYTPEMKAFLKLYNKWLPDLFVDIHTTNGADYQYTLTYAISKHKDVPPKTSGWVRNSFIPYVTNYVENEGFLISPFIWFIDRNVKNGMKDWVAGPRFSNGYASVQNRPGLLIETHMLKPYKERVFATEAMLKGVLELVNNEYDELIEINTEADERAIVKHGIEREPYPISFQFTDEADTFNYKGINYEYRYNKIAGVSIKYFTGEKVEYQIPYYNRSKIRNDIKPPRAYLIPKEWKQLVDKLKLHGVDVTRLTSEMKFRVEKIVFDSVDFAEKPYEGRFRTSFGYHKEMEEVEVPAGTYFVPIDQREIGVIIHLLEPDAPDSFVKWGFLNQIFERKKYFEMYSMAPIAEKMAEENPGLMEEFQDKLENDKEFRENPRASLNFFYERSPYFDEKYMVYPVMRVVKMFSE